MKTKHGTLALSLFAALAMAACDGGTGGSGTSRVSIRLTDAPGDLAEAWVRIDDIYLKGAVDSAGGGRTDLLSARTEWVDLLTLSGGRTSELVNGAVVPAGRYSELRFVVCEAYIVTREGDVYATRDAVLPTGVTADGTLHMPSACSSGFKVKFPADSSLNLASESSIMTVDFDVSQSFGHQAGNSGRWVMHPVLHATSVGFAGGIGGTVAVASGVTLPTCGGAAVAPAAFVPQAATGTTTYTQLRGHGRALPDHGPGRHLHHGLRAGAELRQRRLADGHGHAQRGHGDGRLGRQRHGGLQHHRRDLQGQGVILPP